MRQALAFSTDDTVAGIDWQAFRGQKDKFGNPYMDHARKEVFEASKMNWVDDNDQQRYVRSLFTFILKASADERIKEPDPTLTQYKGWEQSERVFLFRRRDRKGHEFVALFNLGRNAVVFRISADGVEAQGIGREYIVALNEGTNEAEWNGSGRFSLWLDTDALHYEVAAHFRITNSISPTAAQEKFGSPTSLSSFSPRIRTFSTLSQPEQTLII